jgi:hypothetical protein
LDPDCRWKLDDGQQLVVESVESATALPNGSSLTVGQDASSIFAPASGPAIAAPAGVAAVPEPGTWALLVAALWSAAIYPRLRRT